jgi:hypothetical protein
MKEAALFSLLSLMRTAAFFPVRSFRQSQIHCLFVFLSEKPPHFLSFQTQQFNFRMRRHPKEKIIGTEL